MKKAHLKSCLEAQRAALCGKPGLKPAPGDLSSVPTRLLIPCALQEFACHTFWRFDPGSSWKPQSFLRWASWWSRKCVCVQEMCYSSHRSWNSFFIWMSLLLIQVYRKCPYRRAPEKALAKMLAVPYNNRFLISVCLLTFSSLLSATISSSQVGNEIIILWTHYDNTG